MERAVDPEFLAIAGDIANNPWDQSEWAAHEADDGFQTDSYEGGFDATEGAFCFSCYDPSGGEYWFQLTLDEMREVAAGTRRTLQLRAAT